MSGVPLTEEELGVLAARYGGTVRDGLRGTVRRLAPVHSAGPGDLGILTHGRYLRDALGAAKRGAMLLVDRALLGEARAEELRAAAAWVHAHASWVMAELLEAARVELRAPAIGADCMIDPSARILPGAVIGARVTVGPGAVIGAPGFGFTPGPNGKVRAIPHVGGVVIEDDVHIGALSTVAAGTIAPTVIRRGAKLDAQVHVGHNCEIGADTFVAAQTGFAGSARVGDRVLIGGQVGVADHVTIGDDARIAGKSGVIGDVPAGATYAGYPAVERRRWLRGFAELYRSLGRARGALSPTALSAAAEE